MFPGLLEGVGSARAFVREVLADRPIVDTAVQVVGELAANSVLHSRSGARCLPYVVSVEADLDRILISVMDLGSTGPLPRHTATGPDSEYGRGLLIVSALAKAWGADDVTQGRVVWAELVDSALT